MSKIVLRLTRGQQMALCDVLMEVMRCENKAGHSDTFVDCSENPPAETTAGELLRLISDTSEVELSRETA